MESRASVKLQQQPRTWILKLVIVLLLVMVLTWSAAAVDYKGLSDKGPQVLRGILNGLIKPNTGMLFTLSKDGVPYLLLETMAIAFLGTIIGTIISIPIAFFSAKNIAPKFVTYIMGLLSMVIRTIPSFVYGLMFIRVTGPGAFAGVLTMSLSSVGLLIKRNAEVVEDIDRGVLESLDAAGCTGFQKVRYGVFPQLFSNFVSNMIYRFDIAMKDAAVLGLVGAGGIGAPLIFNMNMYRWNNVGALLWGLMILMLIIEYLSSKMRVKLARG